MLLPDAQSLQTDLARARGAVLVTRLAGSREPGASPPAQYPAAQFAEETGSQQYRSAGIYGVVSFCSGIPGALTIIKPETLIRWHRAGFRRYWRWKSRAQGGRPKVREVRQLIREMSVANPFWGRPGSTENSSSSASMWGRRRLRNTWLGEGNLRPKDGRRFFATTLMVSRRWTCSWFRRSRSSYCTGC